MEYVVYVVTVGCGCSMYGAAVGVDAPGVVVEARVARPLMAIAAQIAAYLVCDFEDLGAEASVFMG